MCVCVCVPLCLCLCLRLCLRLCLVSVSVFAWYCVCVCVHTCVHSLCLAVCMCLPRGPICWVSGPVLDVGLGAVNAQGWHRRDASERAVAKDTLLTSAHTRCIHRPPAQQTFFNRAS